MIYFISGLPRAGSTLLASLLRQNPDIHAHVQSPLGQIITTTQGCFSQYSNESAGFLTRAQRVAILRGIFSNYYMGYPSVVFDNNRRWTAHLDLLDELFPGTRVICCVRPLPDIVASFERLFMRDPTQISTILSTTNSTLSGRVGHLMAHDNVLGFAYNCFRDAYFGPRRNMLLILEFEHLVANPIKALKDLHNALELPWFTGYDIQNVVSPPGVEVFDRFLGTPGLHIVKSEVKPYPSQPVLPQALADTLPAAFWINESITKAQ